MNIWNIRNRGTKQPTSKFYVDLAPKENNKEIYYIKSLLHCIIQFEAPHVKKEVVQCKNCQYFGHTKAYCKRKPKCVKCAGGHLTENCLKSRSDGAAKCSNCNGNHPANYRGCHVHKELQKKLYPALRNRSGNRVGNNSPSPPQVDPPQVQTQTRNSGLTYAQAMRQGIQAQQQLPSGESSDDMKELKMMMKDLMAQMTNIISIVSTLVSKMK